MKTTEDRVAELLEWNRRLNQLEAAFWRHKHKEKGRGGVTAEMQRYDY